MKKHSLIASLAAACTVLLATVVATTPASAATGTQLGTGTQLYPRLIRLAHSGDANGQILASTVSFDPNGYGAIWRSTDDGATFSQIGTVRDPGSADGLCCASLYELPSAVGGMPAGTLLWAGSFHQNATDPRMSIDLWSSTDHGVTWSAVSTVLTAPNAKGLWEPEMHVDAAGQLALYYSDETQQPTYSQALMEVLSPDGVTWSAPRPVVALPDSAARPGMAVVRTLPGGSRIMTYEICGSTYNCDVYYRTSADGADWGDPASPGTRIVATDGRYFVHTPNITVTSTGTIVLVGQLVYDSAGDVDASNGTLLMTNSNGGAGAWTTATAPVAVPGAYDNYCPNYSSALLPTSDETGVIEIASDYAGSECDGYFGTGAL